MRSLVAACAFAGLTGLAVCAPPSLASEVGRAAAVVPQASGTPPAQSTRVLQIGLDMVRNERVQTGAEGRAQLLFLDGTALTVGPNSDVTLDEYVFDPAAGSGKIALSATRGVFRIVGGRISKNEPISLRTPTVTIGVRGGVAFANVGETVSAGFVFGEEMTATGGGVTQRTVRPGTEIVTPPSGTPGPPGPLSGETISSSLAATEGTPGEQAGPAVGDDDVAGTQISELSSGNAPDALSPGGLGGPPADASAAEQAAGQSDASQQTATQQAMNTAPSPSASPSSPLGLLVGRYKASLISGVDDGTGDGDPFFNIPFTGGSVSSGRFSAQLGLDPLSFPVVPNSAGMFSFGPSSATASPFGPITGTGWISFAGDFGFIEFTEDDSPDFRGVAFFGLPTTPAQVPVGVTAYSLRNDFVLGGSHIPFIPNSLNGDLGPGGMAYIHWAPSVELRSTLLGGAVVISGQGSTQRWAASVLVGEVTDETSQPFARGAMRGSTRLAASSPLSKFFDGPLASADSGDGSDFLGSQADFVLESLLVDGEDVPIGSFGIDHGIEIVENGAGVQTVFPNAISRRVAPPPLQSRTSRTMFFETAGISQDVAPLSAIANRRFGTNESSPGTITLNATNGTVTGFASLFSLDGGFSAPTVIRFGEPTDLVQSSAFVTDLLWGATESSQLSTLSGNPVAFEGGVVSSGLVTLDGVLPTGVTMCVCQFVDWGFWGGQLFGASIRHEFPLIPFAAGEPVVAGQFPASGSAVYTGAALANFYDGANNFIAGAGMSLSASFAPSLVNIVMDITNLSGNNLTFSGGGSTPGDFPISLISSTGPANFLTGSGSIRFAGPGTPPENVYGHFAAEDMIGVNRAAGVVLGQR